MELIDSNLSENIRDMTVGQVKYFSPRSAQSVATLCSSIGFRLGRSYRTKRDKAIGAQVVERIS